MAAEEPPHVVFFPLMAHGHMIPLFDVARLFTTRGVKATIITTPANAITFSKSDNISLEIIPFPSEEVGLPAGMENFEHVTGDANDLLEKFLNAIVLLESPLESVLERLRPRPICLVSDMFLPWTVDVAARFGIPRVMFHGSGYFGMMVTDALRIHRPHLTVESDDEEFVVPGVPGEVRLTKRKMSPQWKKAVDDGQKTGPAKLMEAAFEAEKKSCGAIMNSFEELEPLYAEHYRKVMGIRSWSVGPVSLCNRNIEEKAARGKKSAIDKHECLRWLDSKPPDSVIYICFGSITNMSTAQLHEIAHGLESSGQNFIWVVKRPGDSKTNGSEEEEWLPSMFEARTKEKGLIIKGWAPQLMILDHVATGGFVTHCGWNSTLEGISAGVRLVTWPVFAEQFLNEMLITDVLRTGVSVGVDRYWDMVVEEASVGREKVEKAVRRVMIGEEAEELRRRAVELKEKALKAVEEGGSSYKGLTNLLEEVGSFHAREEY
uniref:Glycosyltransferase n=1 Tax=Fagopyrum tataricum TaxID=62330 RepID=A0A6B7ENQ6_FAGTA|nr:UGT73BE5 [Fagopyrum tataricum]